MSSAEAGVYWPFKNFLQGSGIVITETATAVTIGTTGAGPGGGDMLKSEFATNGVHGIVDHAVTADNISAAGVVAHATLADQVPWAGVAGKPTSFPADWSGITNKPSAFTPVIHGASHVGTGTDPIPLATVTLSGLMGPLSGKVTDFRAGDGALHDLNTQVGLSVLNMHALLTAYAGLTVDGSNFLINNGSLQVNSAGAWNGIVASTGSAFWSWSTGPDLTHDSVVLYRAAGQNFLTEQYNDSTGAGLWSGRVMNTWNPDGVYTLRDSTQFVTSCALSGDNTAWQNASLRINASNAGAFCGIGFNCLNYWGCALGAWQSGLWLATSSNTFVQLTDNSGHIPFTALQASGTITGNLTVNGTLGVYGQFTAVGPTYLGWNGSQTQCGGSFTVGGNLQINGSANFSGDVWCNKSAAQIIAYQDGSHYAKIQGNVGLYIIGDYNGQGGQIVVQASGGSMVAGITLKSRGGYSFSFWAEDNGHVFLVCNNDGRTAQLL